MKCFGVKTKKGYLANQGDNHWFQDEPKGWGLFTAKDGAKRAADFYLEEGSEYEIIEVEYQ